MCSIKEAVLKNFAIFTGKQLCLKRLQHSCFPKHITNFIYFEKHLRTAASDYSFTLVIYLFLTVSLQS